MNREYHRWYSERLGRDMECLLFGHGGEPVILLPTSRGRFFQNEDFGMIAALQDRIDAGRYLVVCPDSVDAESWFNPHVHPADRVRRHHAYEEYLCREVVPFARARSSGGRLTFGGCSFGGFHGVNVGLRHPELFGRILSMGGKFETDDFLDGHHDADVYFHSATQWVANVDDPSHLEALRRMEIILAVGEHDFALGSNQHLAHVLRQKGIGHHLAVWRGGTHDWPVWREMIREYLPG